MRILGIDYGDRKIGLALSDPLLLTAQPFQSYRRRRKQDDTQFFQNLVSRYKIKKIVVGLPVLRDGTPGTRAHKTKKFARWLEKTVNIPVILWDERFTTKQALEILRNQKAS
ncbi:Holliday junction resolvase RuvX, partial [bacterium]|nr:Holliday junction resolvase RuvX [bacterium]